MIFEILEQRKRLDGRSQSLAHGCKLSRGATRFVSTQLCDTVSALLDKQLFDRVISQTRQARAALRQNADVLVKKRHFEIKGQTKTRQ